VALRLAFLIDLAHSSFTSQGMSGIHRVECR
jgi:hypothetical protein